MPSYIFEEMPVHKACFKLALPVVLSMVVALVYNMVDTYFITKTLNTNLIAGVSIAAPMFTLMIAIGDIFGLGGSALISRLFGQRRFAEGKSISAFCFYAAIVFGILTTVILLVFRENVLSMLGATEDTYTYAKAYYTYIVLGSSSIILAFTPINTLRTEGFASASMMGSLIGSVLNIILDPLFIFTLGLGAAGAAIATVIGHIASNTYFVWFILYRSKLLSVSPKLCKISGQHLKEIFIIGIPASITNIMQSFGVALTNLHLLSYGTEKIAAMGIVLKVNLIAILFLVGFSFGVQPLLGYNYGAQNFKRLRAILKFIFIFQSTAAIFLTLLLTFGAHFIISGFINNESIIITGTEMFRYQLSSMVFINVVLLSTVIFQATGKAVSAFLLSICRQGVIFAIVIYSASNMLGYTGVIVAQPIADFLTAIFAYLLLKKSLLNELHQSSTALSENT